MLGTHNGRHGNILGVGRLIEKLGLESKMRYERRVQRLAVNATIFRHCSPAGDYKLETDWILARVVALIIRRLTVLAGSILSAQVLSYTAPDHESSLQMAPSAGVGSTRLTKIGDRVHGMSSFGCEEHPGIEHLLCLMP